ncbi:MAG: DciA family protein [Planctomycetota bacterium]|jgi:predicted nucleic acid-binding Zn ribbon protein
MDENRLLCNPEQAKVGFRAKSYSGKTARLGESVRRLMDDMVSPRRARFASVAELWDQLLPEELLRHCRLADVSGGQLKVLVDSPPYMHELRMCSSELLGELQRRCPQARLKQIRFAIGQVEG